MIIPLTFEFERSEIIAAIDQKLAKEDNENLRVMRWLMANRYHKPLAHLTFEEVLLIGGHELETAVASEPEVEEVAPAEQEAVAAIPSDGGGKVKSRSPRSKAKKKARKKNNAHD